MSRSVRDLRELICLSRFGFRPDDGVDPPTNVPEKTERNLLFYFDPSILNNWLELTSSRLEKIRSLKTSSFIDFIHFWLKQFDAEHKQSLFQMENELFLEHLILAFTPNDTDSTEINQFARKILFDLDEQIGLTSTKNDVNFLQMIDIFNRSKRDDQYRNLLANLPSELTENITNRIHLQWMLAIRAFGLVAISTAALDFFEKIQTALHQNRSIELLSLYNEQKTSPIDLSTQIKERILTTLRKDYVDVMEYFISTNQVPSDSLDDQNRHVLFHALPLGNPQMIETLLSAKFPNIDINSRSQSGNSLLHVCVTLQRIDFIESLRKFYPDLNLNQRNDQDATALHLTIIYNDISMARFLLQIGADRTLTMKNRTCLQLAKEFDQKDFIDLFSS